MPAAAIDHNAESKQYARKQLTFIPLFSSGGLLTSQPFLITSPPPIANSSPAVKAYDNNPVCIYNDKKTGAE